MDKYINSDNPQQAKAARLVGRLFGKDKDKKPSSAEDVDSFLHGNSDKLAFTGSAPNTSAGSNAQGQGSRPKLGKLDTSAVSRKWPSAANVIQSQQQQAQAKETERPRSAATPPARAKKNKGLNVRFNEVTPEIIGEGGDEFEEPTINISKRKALRAQQIAAQPHSRTPSQDQQPPDIPLRGAQRPMIAPRAPTGAAPQDFENIPSPSPAFLQEGGSGRSTPTIRTPQEADLVNRMQRQMEISEGQALIADRRASAMPSDDLMVGQGQQPGNLIDPRNGMLSAGLQPTNSPRRSPVPQSTTSPMMEQRPPLNNRQRSQSSSRRSPISATALSPETGAHYSSLPYDNESLEEFSVRVVHYYKLFKLSAESVEPLSTTPFPKLLRAASWWFLRGRTAIEQVVKRRAAKKDLEGIELLKAQGICDLAKCYWLLDEILMERDEIDRKSSDQLYALEKNARSYGHHELADILERYQALYAGLRKLTASMVRHDVMPPESDEAILVQGLNTAIWIAYPWHEQKMIEMLAGVDAESILSPGGLDKMFLADALPLGDTANTFVYNRTQVGVFLSSDKGQPQGYRLPCVLSIQRDRGENGLSALISSQDGRIAICVQTKGTYRPSWKDVKWDVKRDFMDIRLPLGFGARVVFPPGDLASAYKLTDYTAMIQRNFRPKEDEDLVMETTVRSVKYMPQDPANLAFPKEEILHCRIRLFEKVVSEQTKTGRHARHRGVRIALTTGPSTRTFCGFSHDLPTSRPIRFEHMRLDYGSSLFLYMDDKPATLALTFETNQDRFVFHNAIIGGQRPNESTQAVLNLTRYTVTGASDADFASTRTVLESFTWRQLHVILHNAGADLNPRAVQTAPHMRIISESQNNDRITDRLLVTPGELKIRLSTRAQTPSISILRKPQQDMTISCPESKTSSDTRRGLAQLLGLMAKIPTIRTYQFATLSELHDFQRAITGFKVLFDGTAATLSIARRRSLVPIHKKWEAIDSRIQVMENGAQHQIAIFFENFAHGECMNFRIKPTDSFETFKKNDKFGVKFAEAKFALPETAETEKKDDEEERIPRQSAFIGTDLLDWVSENDDILITFENEAGMSSDGKPPCEYMLIAIAERDSFAKCLPSETKMGRRFGTIKR